MKRIICVQAWAIFLLAAVSLSWASSPLSAQSATVGKVDLLAVLSFHPRMAFFDPVVGAFYRLEIQDLFRPGLEARLLALSVGASASNHGSAASFASTINPASNVELQAIEQRRRELLRILDTSQDPGLQAQAEGELSRLAQKAAAAEQQAAVESFRKQHPQFTSAEETVRIFREIEQEVLSTIDKISRERGLAVVLNQSTLPPVAVSPLIEVGPVAPEAASRVATSLYFAFLSAASPTTETLENWTATTRHTHLLARMPLRPFPLVLSGGQDLTIEVLERVLQQNAVPDEKARQIVVYLRGLFSEVR